jgi:glycosyltransferase involved in cell wall biosynthesis
MTRYAGHTYACWVHAILRQIRPNVRLLLPGSGPHSQHVKFFAATTGYDSEVFLTEHRFRRDECLAAADVAFFLAERDSGTAALAAAMAAGLPIVASSTADLAELAPGEEAGVPACAIPAAPRDPQTGTAAALRILDDPALARRLSGNAAARAAQRLAPLACRDRLRQVYAEIVRQEAEPASVAT